MSSKIIEEQLLKQKNNSKINYDLIMNEVLKSFTHKPSILIHSCCAVCSTVALERLSDKMDITIYFYNPNIHPKSEFLRRAKVQEKFVDDFNDFFNRDVKYMIGEYRYKDFNDKVIGYEDYSEQSQVRCEKCYSLRLDVCANKAKELNFDYWATALTLSPLKNAQLINDLGLKTAKDTNTQFFVTDLKKNKGNIRSKELCEQFDVYRQCYCGCHYAYQKQDIDMKEQINNAKKYLADLDNE